jgi:kynurenine formamidase
MVHLIDLSHPLKQGQASFPGDPDLEIAIHATVASGAANVTRLTMGTHQGTHLDAPFHIFDDGRTVDDLPLEQVFGPARLVDLAPGGQLEPRMPLGVELFEPHAQAFGVGARVIYRTGWDRHFGRPDYFTDFPSLTPEAARWMADCRIRMLGMDTPSPGQQWRECHQALLRPGREVVIVESLANLDRLPAQFTFIGFPLKLTGCDGSPIRAVAWIED